MKERQRELEEMGINISGGGIGIDKTKYYLLNMNPDPSMSLLLFYLKVFLLVEHNMAFSVSRNLSRKSVAIVQMLVQISFLKVSESNPSMPY